MLWCATLVTLSPVGATGALAEIAAEGIAPGLSAEVVLLPVGLMERTT